MSETLSQDGSMEMKEKPNLQVWATESESRFNNFLNALSHGGKTISISTYEMNKDDPVYGKFTKKPSARNYELSRLIAEGLEMHNISAEKVSAGIELMSQAKRGEELSEDQQASLSTFLDAANEIFDGITQQNFEGEPFTSEEISS